MEKINIYKASFDERSNIEAIAFVKNPAIMKDFLTTERLYADKVLNIALFENRVTSPLLISNQYIYRKDVNGEQYYIYYSDADVVKVANYLIKNNDKIKFNIEHDSNRIVEGVEFVGICVTDDVIDNNFYSLPKQTLFVQLNINNDELLQMIKNKEVAGLSIEGEIAMYRDETAYTMLQIEQEEKERLQLYERVRKNNVFKIKNYGSK